MSNRKTPPEPVQASPILETQVWSRMNRRDDNWMGAVVGETGKGKSYTCLSIAEAVDPNFTIDQVAFGLVEFMELVMNDSLDRGSMIILEEASVEAAAEDFHEVSNKVLRTVLETWREQNRGALLNLPTFSRLDKGAKIRMTALIQQQAKYEREGYSVATYKHLQTNSDTGKIYRHYPTINGQEHRTLKIAPPSDDLREAYEKRASEYTSELNQELLEELLEAESEAEEEDEKDPMWVAEDILDSGLEEYVDENHGQKYLSRQLIELDYDIGSRRSKKVKAALEREASDELLDRLMNGSQPTA
jgi:hypothetical protein